MNNQQNRKLNPNAPVSILVHGSNELSANIAKALLEQGGNVILVDKFDSKGKKYITDLKSLGSADFVDFKGLETLLKSLPRIDYIFYFLHDYLSETEKFSSKDFLDETARLNSVIKASKQYETKLSLVSSIKLNQNLSAHILNANLSSPSPYSAIELQKYCETLVAEGRDKLKINARIIRLGTLLGQGVERINDETISTLISDSINRPNLNIYGEGLDIHYLINISDASYGILKLTFLDKTEGEVISLANDHDYTTLSLAYKLLELNQDISQIKFHPSQENQTIIFDQYVPAVNATKFGWSQKITIEQSLIQTISNFDNEKGKRILEAPKQNISEEIQTEKLKKAQTHNTVLGNFIYFLTYPFTKSAKSILNWLKTERETLNTKKIFLLLSLFTAFGLFFYFLILPIVGLGIGSTLLYLNTQKAVTYSTSLDFENASKYLDRAQKNIVQTERFLNDAKWMFSLLSLNDMYDNSAQLLFASDYAVSGAKTLTSALVPLAQYAKEFKPSLDFGSTQPSSTREYRIYLKELQTNLKGLDRATNNIQIASELLNDVSVSAFPSFTQQYLINIKIANEKILNQIQPAKEILTFVPELLGVDERKTYLVLLQNPGELRATGGWLSSYAIVSIEGGQIRELKVDDIYNAEGQLKIANKYFDAPADMQKALGTTRWSLSLSNWNPNFPDSAKNAQYFLTQLDPGSEYDGVIALDTEVIKSLLNKWGGLQIPGESELITGSNLDEKIFKLHTDFKPGQSLKATFLANLANETLKRVLGSNISSLQEISDVVTTSLNQKHILVYLQDSQAQNFFSKSGWSGTVDTRYQWSPIPIDWNWGANKANLYIERNHTLQISIGDENKIDYDYSSYMQNKSTNTIYPQGEYVNYERIYIPSKAVLTSVKGFVENKYSVYNENGYKVVAGWFNIPIKSTKSLQVKYTLTRGENDIKFPITKVGDNREFDFTIFKQPGTMSDIYDLTITYPEKWSALKNDNLTRTLNTLTTRINLDTDKSFDIKWQEK